MGCVASKKTISITPAIDSSGIHVSSSSSSSRTTTTNRSAKKEKEKDCDELSSTEKGLIVGISSQRSLRMRNIHKYLEGEQVAAGWPPWLSQVAGEAIQGWVPLKLDSFEKLEKVGQGTYSNVFKARDLNSGKIVALKKVRFDNFEPESVRFMAREIQILRRLDHPNVMKLEGLITSKLSCSLYLVFEYMEHDLAGLSSSPDIKFTEPQVKCYMKQLLSALSHIHSKGIIHRDIKCANLLINNSGQLKMADFGLANSFRPNKPLTSRVVTLWYRPPELLLGSTSYDTSVDLWSVGCVFAEMYLGKPILQGRTEIEQLHKIFKLCGSPSDEYWKKTKLPHATIFKPHRPYTSSLRETLKSVPENSFNLLETLLAVEPNNRGTAEASLESEYFKTKPIACEPSSLPKYAPNKEMDAKIREDSQRRKTSSRSREEGSRKQSRLYRAARDPIKQETKANGTSGEKSETKQNTRLFPDLKPFPKMEKIPNPKIEINDSDTDTDAMTFSGPLIVSSSSKFSWANNKQKDGKSNPNNHNSSSSNNNWLFHRRSSSKGNASNQESEKEKESDLGEKSSDLGGKSSGSSKRGVLMRWSQLGRPDSFDSFDTYGRDEVMSKRSTTSGGEQEEEKEKMEFSGPLLSQTHKIDEFLERHERHVRQAVRKSWFKKWKRQAK